MQVLLKDDSNRPNTYPIELFKIVDGNIPTWWKVAYYDNSNGIDAIWGYEDLLSISYFEALFERSPEALASFEKEASRVEGSSA